MNFNERLDALQARYDDCKRSLFYWIAIDIALLISSISAIVYDTSLPAHVGVAEPWIMCLLLGTFGLFLSAAGTTQIDKDLLALVLEVKRAHYKKLTGEEKRQPPMV